MSSFWVSFNHQTLSRSQSQDIASHRFKLLIRDFHKPIISFDQFISEFNGLSFDGTEKLFHDYLILKVDPSTNEIIDGYQYTLEWAEPPAVSDLYQLSSFGHILKSDLSLDDLKMKLVASEYRIEEKEDLNDNGVLIIK